MQYMIFLNAKSWILIQFKLKFSFNVKKSLVPRRLFHLETERFRSMEKRIKTEPTYMY